jgi:hypothetical protein
MERILETIETNKKIVFVDSSYIFFRALFACRNIDRAQLLYQQMLFGSLRRLNLNIDDIVILALDSPKGSWRKDHDQLYKSNRKADREKHKDIDWNNAFKLFEKTISKIYYATNFHVILIDNLEADDIIAYGCKYFKNNEVIIVSADSDFEMLTVYPNVKLFSPVSKYFKKVSNPYTVLHSKIKKETADNLVSPILCEKDYERRNLIVNLINLPEDIEIKVDSALSNLDYNKDFNINMLTDYMRKLYNNIYDSYIPPEKKTKPRKKHKQTLLI